MNERIGNGNGNDFLFIVFIIVTTLMALGGAQ